MAQIRFWEQKLAASPADPTSQSKLAGRYAAFFKLTGDVAKLHASDSLLRLVNAKLPNQVGTLQALAANAVTRHAFAEAERYMRQALATGEHRFASSLLLTDVLMERGNFSNAARLLHEVASTSHFDYLIREMKMLDQKGDLGGAIGRMEQALALAKDSGSKDLLNWSLSNLGDMYGHDGRIQQSYETYLAALAQNPADLHSLKGIAWVAFSHDKNPGEARRILGFLKKIHPVPDYDLLLAEIADFENNPAEASQFRQLFFEKTSDPAYGNMYQAYRCELKSSEKTGTGEALRIAEQEIVERPHPLSYNLLAWANFQRGNLAVAVSIVKKHVLDHTEEPNALYRSGIILKSGGDKKQAKKCLEAALEAGYELGPVAVAEIKTALAQL